MTELLLIDLSSIAHPIFHMSGKEQAGNPDHVSQQTVARVRALASSHPHAAVCCDSGKSFRAEIDPTYKATRDREHSAVINHQITLAMETLRGDGFPVWAIKGQEADDLVASGVAQALKRDDVSVLVVSGDKDLLALVGPRVSVKSIQSGNVMDEASVLEKFGVRPSQMTDYLSLVGDSSDNIKGAKGIGPKKAAELLKTFPDLDFLFTCIDDGTATGMTPSTLESLTEFRPRMEIVRSLVRMRTDAPINIEEAFQPRVPKDAAAFGDGDDMGSSDEHPDLFDQPEAKVAPEANPLRPATTKTAPPEAPDGRATPVTVPSGEIWTKDNAAPAGVPLVTPTKAPLVEAVPEPVRSLAIRAEPAPAPAEWSMQLEPRCMDDAKSLAKWAFESRMFSAYGTPQAIMMTVLAGRELGIQSQSALRTIHNIKGKTALSAQLMVGLILKSGLAEYFRPVEFDIKHATWETLRKGKGQKPFTLTHTIEMAVIAELVKGDSNWLKVPEDMLNSRASSRLARLIYPDLMAGMYTPEELAEIRE